ncbi:hypothetical protein FPV67DRAFT_1761896 [Lyophyllum atratum]|nr:hypothetical protein FPV67DRAFT_1761896 [Lyophyllum atratum]
MAEPIPAPLLHSIISLGHDLFAMKLYWVAISSLWVYDYFLTLPDEIEYGWRGKKSPVFWLFILNRYLCPIFIIITLVAYFVIDWTLDTFNTDLLPQVCARYGFMETLETMLLTCTAELFLTLRVYALIGKRKPILFIAGLIILWQWAIALYAMSQSSKGTPQPALLLSSRATIPGLPPLPDADPYHICIFISTLTVTPWVEAWLCLSLAFDGLAFIGIIYGVVSRSRATRTMVPLLHTIRRDGIMYFFVLFSSNLVWLLLLLHARLSLKFIHNQPAMDIGHYDKPHHVESQARKCEAIDYDMEHKDVRAHWRIPRQS